MWQTRIIKTNIGIQYIVPDFGQLGYRFYHEFYIIFHLINVTISFYNNNVIYCIYYSMKNINRRCLGRYRLSRINAIREDFNFESWTQYYVSKHDGLGTKLSVQFCPGRPLIVRANGHETDGLWTRMKRQPLKSSGEDNYTQ